VVNKQFEDFSKIIQEEYDPDMMKNIDYVDEFCLYENEPSISESVLEKQFYLEKNLQEAKEEQVEINNIQPNREHWRKRKDKKMRRKKRDKYQITQRNNNLIINIEMTNTPEKKQESEIEKKLCQLCKKISTNYKHIVSFDDFINFFKNMTDQKENKNPDFIENSERILEISNAFDRYHKHRSNNLHKLPKHYAKFKRRL
jgi:hypothetical protein